MELTDKQALIKGAIQGCGIGTAIINGIILFFTLPKLDMISNTTVTFNFLGLALGCGVLCPLFGKMTLKSVLEKNPQVYLGAKKDHALAKFVPDHLGLAAIVIGLLTAIILWGIPYGVALVLKPVFVLNRWIWIILIGCYSGVCASFAAYFGMLRSYYTRK